MREFAIVERSSLFVLFNRMASAQILRSSAADEVDRIAVFFAASRYDAMGTKADLGYVVLLVGTKQTWRDIAADGADEAIGERAAIDASLPPGLSHPNLGTHSQPQSSGPLD
jgi:hypothetical protein